MSPGQQISALMATVNNTPPDTQQPCKANKIHTINVLVQWRDDRTPVPTASFTAYRGKALYTADMAAKGKYAEKSVPPGSYRIFFPDIHDAEITEG